MADNMKAVEDVVSAKPQPAGWKNFWINEAGWKGDFTHLNLKDPFHMKKNGVTWKTEIRAGMVTFLTMVYIVPVNASILANVIGSGPPFSGTGYTSDLIVATAASCGISCILMGLMSNFPFALAPGMGTNAFFAFTVVAKFGVPWQTALGAIWVAGFVFAFLSVTGIRTYMVKIMPSCIRLSMACGIGLFLAFIGLKDMGIITGDNATLVTLNLPLSSINTDFQKIWMGIVVLFMMGVLLARNFPGAILVGILFGSFVCWIDGAVVNFDSKDPMKNPSHFCYPSGQLVGGNRMYSVPYAATNVPNAFSGLTGGPGEVTSGGCTVGSYIYYPVKFAQAASAKNIAGKVSFKSMNTGAWAGAFLTFIYTDILDNTGTFFAVCKMAGMLDPVTLELPRERANMAYLADAISTIIGASLGVSTVVTYIESGTGVRDGGRTGLVAIACGIMFLFCLPFSPWLSQVPPLASGPALVVVGVLMMEGVKGIAWTEMEDALPAFLCLIIMPLTYNIPYGIVAGCAAWLMGQVGLAPFRLWNKEDPLVKFKKMLANDLTDGMTKEELAEIRSLHAEESVRVAKLKEATAEALPTKS